MEIIISNLNISRTCKSLKMTRQSYYEYKKNSQYYKNYFRYERVLQKVREIRLKHPRMGTLKLYAILSEFISQNGIKIGRNVFNRVLRENKMLVRIKRNKQKTTNSKGYLNQHKYLAKDFVPARSNQLYVSDITYWEIGNKKFSYLSFVTDAFSKKIVGYNLSTTLKAEGCLKSLEMAISNSGGGDISGLIHHSDRGSQYRSMEYLDMIEKSKIRVSMTQDGNPYDNALAERINNTIKNEYLINYKVNSMEEARAKLDEAVWLYNNERPHLSLGFHKPEEVHSSKITSFSKKWKTYNKKIKETINS